MNEKQILLNLPQAQFTLAKSDYPKFVGKKLYQNPGSENKEWILKELSGPRDYDKQVLDVKSLDGKVTLKNQNVFSFYINLVDFYPNQSFEKLWGITQLIDKLSYQVKLSEDESPKRLEDKDLDAFQDLITAPDIFGSILVKHIDKIIHLSTEYDNDLSKAAQVKALDFFVNNFEEMANPLSPVYIEPKRKLLILEDLIDTAINNDRFSDIEIETKLKSIIKSLLTKIALDIYSVQDLKEANIQSLSSNDVHPILIIFGKLYESDRANSLFINLADDLLENIKALDRTGGMYPSLETIQDDQQEIGSYQEAIHQAKTSYFRYLDCESGSELYDYFSTSGVNDFDNLLALYKAILIYNKDFPPADS